MQFQNVRTAAALAIIAGTSLAGTASAQFVSTAILAGTGPRSVVPGTTGTNPGELFLPTGSFMDRVYRSSNGNHWILTARTNTGATATDEIVITGSGTTGTVRAREGGAYFGGADAGRTLDSGQIDERVSINDSGDFVFTGNLSPATSTDDEQIIRGNAAGTLSIATREGATTTAGRKYNERPGISTRNAVCTRDSEVRRRSSTMVASSAMRSFVTSSFRQPGRLSPLQPLSALGIRSARHSEAPVLSASTVHA
jgi:hypothetical protein